MQNLTKHLEKTEKQKEQKIEAIEHIKFVVEIYREHAKNGRLFLHEHPAQASSWDLEEIREMASKEGVTVTVADQCMYGLKTWKEDRKKFDTPARKGQSS